MKKAEAAAAEFVRDHEQEIIAVGNYLHRKGEATGLELRVLLNRLSEERICAAGGVDWTPGQWTPEERALYCAEVDHRMQVRSM